MTQREQIGIPPREDQAEDRITYDGPIPRPFETWTADDGWCSACFVDGTRVVYMGGRNAFVGICAHCLGKIADTMRSPSQQASKP